MSAQPSAAQPLAGLVVLEIGHSVAMPFAGQILADLGAQVTKVENPVGGDDARSWGPPFWHGSSATFQSLNRNKGSIALDLKDPAEAERLRVLADGADVVLQNMRPGLVERYGVDAERLRARNPRLIYFNLGAYGDAGPLGRQPGYDPLMQAFSGIMSVTGEPGGEPVRTGPAIIDMGSGMWAVVGVLAALLRRRDTGQGCTIDGSLYETALAWMTMPIAGAMATGQDPGRTGSETPILAPYKAFAASDGHVVIAAGNDNLYRKLCAALERPEWASDPRFLTNADRVANREAINALVEAVVRTGPCAQWTERLNAVGVPCAPLQQVSQVLAHPQTRALEMISPTPDGAMELVRLPLRFDGERPAIRKAAPALGEDAEG